MVEFYRSKGAPEPPLISAYVPHGTCSLSYTPQAPEAAVGSSAAPRNKRRAVSPAAAATDDDELTPLERRVVLCNRACGVLMAAA